MKKYKEYMDGVRASDTLHQRLVELEAPAKRPVSWKRYGSMAAALLLVCGLGAWGLNRLHMWAGLVGEGSTLVNIENCVVDRPGTTYDPDIDIAVMDPDDLNEPAEKTLGGYEVTTGSGPEAVVTHYILPYIEYGEPDGTEAAGQIAADWDIPVGASKRELTREEIVALMGGEDAVDTHLDWGKYELSGWGAWYEDGSFWGAYLNGYQGPLDHFEFAVTANQLPPACVVYANSVTQEIRGLTVAADGHDGKDGCSRRVSFMKDDYGCRFDLTSTDTDQAELLVSRLVCRIADAGLELWTVDPSVETYACPDCGQTFAVDGMRAHIHSFTGEDDGSTAAEPYDPAGPVSVSDAPAASGEICGLPLADDPIWRDTGSAAPAQYQSEPPILRVLCSEGSADGRSGNYEWTYTDAARDESASVTACGVHPLDFRDAPSLTTADETVRLNFFDLPDRVSAVCWPDSQWGNASAASQAAQTGGGEHAYDLTLNEGGWVYEISAQWDGLGRAAYVFHLTKT